MFTLEPWQKKKDDDVSASILSRRLTDQKPTPTQQQPATLLLECRDAARRDHVFLDRLDRLDRLSRIPDYPQKGILRLPLAHPTNEALHAGPA